MLHLFVPQSITPLIWAYLDFSLHMPFAPFWPSAFIPQFIFFFCPSLAPRGTSVLNDFDRLRYTYV